MKMQMSKCAYDDLSQDELLVQWNILKGKIETIKNEEMELRKYIVSRAFPEKHEGTNTKELGQGYQLKAGVKFNYSLDNDNKKINAALDAIVKCGNQGAFIAERLVNWKPSLSLSEYRELQDDESDTGKQILRHINSVLTIKEAAPTLEIKVPKSK
jgi:hypothetical protein